MLTVVVRSKRDADAVKAMLRVFCEEWDIDVKTLQGARRAEDALRKLEEIVSEDRFYLLLLGREDSEMAQELDRVLPPNIAVHVVPRARVRNARIEQLAHEFDVGRSKFRLVALWEPRRKGFVFGLRQGMQLEEYEYNPAYDVFLGLGKGFGSALRRVLGADLCRNPLLVRKFGGVHDVYCGLRRAAVLEIPDEGFRPHGKILCSECVTESADEHVLLEINRPVLELYERIALSFLGRFREWADTVIVPWSGGKDSTATLLIALRAFPRKKIRVLFSDTGTEFPWTVDYVEEVSKTLGVEIHRVYAGVDKGLLEEGMPMPTHDNRWCTARKIGSVMVGVMKLSEGNTLIVTGDRDAESRRRSLRPPVRRVDSKTLIVTPIKLWSAAHVQLYILSRGLRLNPLYEKGFYRIGCYICPALRSWELFIMNSDLSVSLRLQRLPLYRRFIEHRMKMQVTGSKHDKEAQVVRGLLNICG
ncbi:MAG: phosphoadenosine phosphosulfate reductase [Thermoprotei archaeon]|nr:MAG: phosphoadenosine phosphosulfate reductase [Thermoprotei archaeon]